MSDEERIRQLEKDLDDKIQRIVVLRHVITELKSREVLIE